MIKTLLSTNETHPIGKPQCTASLSDSSSNINLKVVQTHSLIAH